MRAENALVIVNRKSRRGTGDIDEGLKWLQDRGMHLAVHATGRAEKVPALIRRHRAGADRIIIGGGDGTLNIAAEALVESRLPVGILPLGTANDLARTLGIPAAPKAACQVIAGGRIRKIDLGWVNGKLFFNVASIGLSVRVTAYLSHERKRRWGTLAYARSAVEAIRDHQPFRARIECDGETIFVKSIQITVGNGRYHGGGMAVAHDARIDDQVLNLYSLKPLGLWGLAKLLLPLRKGVHPPEEITDRACREIMIRTRKPLKVDTDGELTTHTPARFKVMQKILPVFIPP